MNTCRALTIWLLAAGLVACEGSDKPSQYPPKDAFYYPDLSDATTDLAGDVATDLAADSGDDAVEGFDPADFCPTKRDDVKSFLIPRPERVFGLGMSQEAADYAGMLLQIEPATYSLSGVPEVEMREAREVLAALKEVEGGDGANPGLAVIAHTVEEFQEVHKTCNLPKLNGSPGAYYLVVRRQAKGIGAHLFGADGDGIFYALKTLMQLMPQRDARIVEAELFDQPVGPMRGVLEGFYGAIWPREGRIAMMRELANLKFNFFMYAPKDDGYVNLAWPTPYPIAELNYIKDLIAEAKRQHLQMCWAIHTLWPVTFSTDTDIDLIVDKMDQVVERGATCLAIAFDDLEKILQPKDQALFDSYTAAQIDWLLRFGEEVQRRHAGIRLVLTPHEYYTAHPEFATDFLEITQALPDYWEYGWTGQQIGSGAVSAEDAEAFLEVHGEYPILGDNYPVNDMMVLMWGEHYIHLGPLQGRDPKLPGLLPAIAFNAASDMYGSLPALATISDWLWNPTPYDPEISAGNSAIHYAGLDDAAALELMAALCRSDMISPSVAPELQKRIDALWPAWESGDAQAFGLAKGDLQQYFLLMKEIPDVLLKSKRMHPGIAANITPHIQRAGEYGTMGTTILMALGKKLEGVTPPEVVMTQVQQLLDQTSVEMAPHPTGEVMPLFMQRALEELKK